MDKCNYRALYSSSGGGGNLHPLLSYIPACIYNHTLYMPGPVLCRACLHIILKY